MNKEVVKTFICRGNRMAVVMLEGAAHIMPYDEWKSVYGKLHPERWNNSKETVRNRKNV